MTSSRTFVLWVAILAAPAAWVAQLVAGYALEDFGCATGGGDGTVAGVEPATLELVVSVVALAVAVLGGLAAFATWQGDDDSSARWLRFLGLAALLGSGLFVLTILLGGAAVLTLSPCEAT